MNRPQPVSYYKPIRLKSTSNGFNNTFARVASFRVTLPPLSNQETSYWLILFAILLYHRLDGHYCATPQHCSWYPNDRDITFLPRFRSFSLVWPYSTYRKNFIILAFKINTLRYKFDSKLFLMIDPTFGILFKIRVFVSSLVLWLLFNTEIIE